jgi:hypothetical protein
MLVDDVDAHPHAKIDANDPERTKQLLYKILALIQNCGASLTAFLDFKLFGVETTQMLRRNFVKGIGYAHNCVAIDRDGGATV